MNNTALKKISPVLILLISLLLLIPRFSTAQDSTQKVVLDNGLTIIATQMPASQSVSVYGLIKTGSANEGKYLGSGISHFVEHMLFKGTEGHAVGEIANQIQAVGGNINAQTGQDFTMYTISVPPEHFDMALNILTDMLMNSKMDPDEVEKERTVIRGEMRLYEDNPERKLMEIANQQTYLVHPYRFPVIGYKTLFNKLTQKDLLDYYRTHYVPNNMIISVAGNINGSEIVKKVTDKFKDFDRGYSTIRNLPPEPRQLTPRSFEISYPTDLSRLIISFPGTSLLNDDLYALDILATILGRGGLSRLYRDLFKKQHLVYSISAGNHTPVDVGTFEIFAELEDKNITKAIEAILTQIELIKSKEVTPDELQRAKSSVLAEHILGRQTSMEVAYNQAYDEAFTGDYNFTSKYVYALQQVTSQQVQQVAKKYLNNQVITKIIMHPQSSLTENKIMPLANQTEIKKYILDNGLTILIKENHQFPTVSMAIVSKAGIHEETAETNGLSKLVASTWVSGTNFRSEENIIDLTEQKGIQLGSMSGKNSLNLYADMLKDSFDVGLDLIEDVIKNPVFPQKNIDEAIENFKIQLRSRDDDISAVTGFNLKQTLFQSHPLRFDENGTVDSLNKLKRDDVVGFYKKYVVPNNMVIAVYGDINTESTFLKLKKKFGVLERKELLISKIKEDPILEARIKDLEMNKEQAMLMVGYHGSDLKNQDRHALTLMSSVLGSSFNGRLFKSIREKMGESYTLGGYFVPSLDLGIILFYVLTTEEKLNQSKDIMNSEIRSIRENLISSKDLDEYKNYLIGNHKMGLETNSALCLQTALDELYGLGFDNYKDYERNVREVTPEQIQKVAQTYLDPSKMVIIMTRPKRNQPQK